MKTTIFSLLFTLVILPKLSSQSCEIPDILFQEYEMDVSHLAITRMDSVNSPQINFAVIPEVWTDTIWEGLAAIYNSDLPQRDIVFDEYCIHHSEGSTWRIAQNLYVNVDPNTDWYSNWENGEILTNIPEVDAFMQRYEFELNGTLGVTFKIKTKQLLNLPPLADTLEMFDEVNFSEVNSYIGGGDKIIYSKVNNERYYDFIIGWGDCPAGCIYDYTWSFKVDENCNATFLEEWGDTINFPAPINCDISTSSSTINSDNSLELNIFPNPTNGKFNVQIDGEISGQLKFSVINILGNELQNGFIENMMELDISDFVKGVYFVLITGENNQKKTFKLIKE